ncbi:hypothetical protein HGA13_27665 [Nocardia speluncae]|uniref:Uncharacterized protein n=1 Tax=Nocardia speluncae TaxID=419477 RepID=A0A846XKQ2_9NOCA|nr:hypothetical protein [Nocardia speluncae]NKY36818.1 hypothetical protein [Nocardia speluncae]
MKQNVRINGNPYRVVGRLPLSPVSRACYGKYRFTLRRTTDGTLWSAFGTRISPVSELVRQRA